MRTTTVGRRVQWARRRAGLTQHGLAEAAGLPQPSVARIERGTVIPRTATLIALLAAAGHRLAVEPIGPAVDREAIQRRLAMNVPRRTRKALGRAAGILVRVACLEDLIRAREARCTPEDREAAAVLRAVEEESQLR